LTGKPLTRKLRSLIEANGPMSVADYMAHCLSDPEHGYYMRRDPFGARGDFVTAPEVSQMFGEIVGAWLIETWRLSGAPSPVRLIELGPGRGTLMADILQVAALAPDFKAAASIHLVETSPVLTVRQRKTLAGSDINWHPTFSQIPAGPLLLVANEFFDALPVRQFVRRKGAWRERVVGLGADGRFAFGIGPGLVQGPHAPEGALFEIRPSADALISEISQRITAECGSALIIDYGYGEGGAGDTLQAVRGHAFADPLEAPGEADLTAHVDFGALARAAKAEGAQVHGPIAQREFLVSLGLLERAGKLGAGADRATRDMLRAAVERLAGPDQMGTLFKVMAITPLGILPPPFDTQQSRNDKADNQTPI
jgi:NADH dehydrogenase [ubiquinone] 1 alpha subcomplex assembly factor 7